MSDQKIDCYIIPSVPMPVILPVDCVAEIAPKPAVEPLNDAKSSWMKGHVSWRNQRLPVLSFSTLQDESVDESFEKNPHLIVLNPIPNSERKTYSGLLCYGEIKQITVEPNLKFAELEEEIDLSYISGVIAMEGENYIVPALSNLGDAYNSF